MAVKTVASYTATYCPVSEFIKRFDVRTIKQLASDTDTPIADPTNDANVLACLRDASGDLESAALMGGRYTADDLAELLGSDTNARATLYRIVAGRAFTYLRERRPILNVPKADAEERAEAFLEALVEGKRIFGFQEVMDAGVLDHEVETVADVENRRLATWTASRLFGTRNNQL